MYTFYGYTHSIQHIRKLGEFYQAMVVYVNEADYTLINILFAEI